MNFLSNEYHIDSSWIHSNISWKVAVGLASTATFISLYHITQHLRYYTMPEIQIYVVRILAICPIYALCSALAVSLGTNGIYAEVFRDIYEAFVIYSFLHLILEYCGGESDCVYQMENESSLKLPCPLCFLPSKPRDARLLRECYRGVLQFAIVKPIMAIIDIIMLITGLYFNIIWQIIETIIYNISYGIALYSLYVFYLAIKDMIRPFKPVSKFITVKIIIFATYYQSLLITLFLPISNEDCILWNDILLCFEMILFAILLWIAFPVSDFIGGIPDRRLFINMKEIFQVQDIYQDMYHNFMPVYQDYALQKSQNEAPEIVRLGKYFTGNLGTIALEMTGRYRGRSKRMAFNSLLRSVKGATIRHLPNDYFSKESNDDDDNNNNNYSLDRSYTNTSRNNSNTSSNKEENEKEERKKDHLP